MTSIEPSLDGRGVGRSSKVPMSRKRRIYFACLLIFMAGSVVHIGLDRYWHAVRPHTIEIARGYTQELGGPTGAVFIKPNESHVLEWLSFVPYIFLLAGALVWAQAPEEWK